MCACVCVRVAGVGIRLQMLGVWGVVTPRDGPGGERLPLRPPPAAQGFPTGRERGVLRTKGCLFEKGPCGAKWERCAQKRHHPPRGLGVLFAEGASNGGWGWQVSAYKQNHISSGGVWGPPQWPEGPPQFPAEGH